MFTGIVEEIGNVRQIRKSGGFTKLTIVGERIFSDLRLGDSVAVNGVCLTAEVISNNSFTVEIMNETLGKSTLGSLSRGDSVNLERALALGERLGGHIVSGHIDGIGMIEKTERDAASVWYTISAQPDIMRYIVLKGSVAIDGISLTVARREKASFAVSIISHTAKSTVLSLKKAGDRVNLENDMLAKYVERLCGDRYRQERSSGSITRETLLRAGF